MNLFLIGNLYRNFYYCVISNLGMLYNRSFTYLIINILFFKKISNLIYKIKFRINYLFKRIHI